MRAVCTLSQLLLVMAGVKCSAGYGRNLFLLLFLIFPPFSIFFSILNKKERKKENSTKKKSKPKSTNDEIHVYYTTILTTKTVWDADICPSMMIDLITY